MIQGSADWFAARCGRITASRIGEATRRLKKGGWGAERAAVMAELVAERLTGETAHHYVSPVMAWGSQQQAAAAIAYEFETGCAVAEAGYVQHPTIEDSGASPDGYVGDDGLIEIKCPTTQTHIATLDAQEVPPEHLPQILWQMACTGRQWCDFVSYDPRLPAHLQLFVKRVDRDDAIIAEFETDVRQFLVELAAKVERLHSLYEPRTQADAA